MKCLYVLYDERCGLCRWARDWASEEEAFVPLVFVAAGSPEASRRFPTLASPGGAEELIAVDDEGAVYRNDAAWVMCLFALVEFREWAIRIASPLLRPLARQAFAAVSRGRRPVSSWLGLDDRTAVEQLRQVQPESCDVAPAASPLHQIHEMISATWPPALDGVGGPRTSDV
jgi:predicted DCC family thiol-disulfide oxidoreductase YuxK